MNGSYHTLSEYRAKYTVVVLWASWCPVCIHELKELELLYRAYKTRGLSVVAVAIDDTRAGIFSRFSPGTVSFPILLDEYKTLGRLYGARTIPHTLIFGSEGNLILDSADANEAVRTLRQLLKEIDAKKS